MLHGIGTDLQARRPAPALVVLAMVALAAAASPAAAQDRPPDALATAQELKRRGATAAAVARTLRADLRVTAITATDVMKTVGYDVRDITAALHAEYVLSPLDLYDVLKRSGYPSTTIGDALDRNRVRVDLSCIDAQGYPSPCGNFGGNTANPVMGQLTWTPAGQGTVNGTLTITGSGIPQVDVRIGNTVLAQTSASSGSVVAQLPASPMTGALTLRRVSDGVVGQLEPSYSVVAAAAPELNWPGFGAAARDAAVQEAHSWIAGAAILASHCTVLSLSATGVPGVFTSTNPFQQRIRSALLAQGAPADLASAWDQAFRHAWSEWSTQVLIPGLPFYPTFASVVADSAAPTANVPHPLALLPSTGLAAMTAPALAERVTNAIGSAVSGVAAATAITTFATDIGARFATFHAGALVWSVYGSGPVPGFKNSGILPSPVVGGKCEGTNVLSSTVMF